MCSVKIIFFAFRSSDIRLFLVYKTSVFFLSLLLFKKYFLSYFPGHGCFTNFRVNERYPICSQKSFFYAACFFLACLHKLAGNYLNHFRKLMLLFLSRMFHYVMKRGFLLGKCVFIAVITIL